MNPNPSPCIDADVLAAFAEGKVQRRDIPMILAHVDACPECFDLLREANEAVAGQRQAAVPFRWLAAAAVIAVALLAVPLAQRFVFRSRMSRLVSLAPHDERNVEPRLTGGFTWAPYRGPMRATDAASNARKLQLDGVAGDAVEAADRDKTMDAQRTAGVALVLIDQPLDAVTRLRNATARTPDDARAWSDLGAAEYSAALRLARSSLYPQALSAVDRALRLDPNLQEALFNRALILERLGLRKQAYDAWQAYLRVDGSSPWASEAREHASRLTPGTAEEQFKQQLPRLEAAVARRDDETLLRVVDRYREQSRAFAEAEYLGKWASAERGGDANEAKQQLDVARSIGDALSRLSGESLVREAVRAIDAATPPQRAAIAEAHEVYRRGRIAYSKHEVNSAEPDLRHAAELFESASDPMSIMARYYAALARFDQNDAASARAELTKLRTTLEPRPQFAAARALVDWELALCAMVDDDWTGATPPLVEAQSIFRRIGERSNLGFIETLLGDDLMCLDRLDEAWAARIRSFELLSSEGRGDRFAAALNGAARMEVRAGRLEPARAMLQIEEAVEREARNDVLLTNVLVLEATLSAGLGDDVNALRQAREAASVAGRIGDASLRERAMLDAEFAGGAAMLHGDPHGASAALTRAIDGYQSHGMAYYLPESRLLRARAALRLGRREDAANDLEQAIASLEEHRIPFAAGIVGTGVFDAGTALFQDAIALSIDRGDVAKAFAYAERSRPRTGTAITAGQLQKKLAGSDAAVLELVVLPSEVIAFGVTADDVVVSRHGGEGAAAPLGNDEELYELLIRPSERVIARARELIIVPDPKLSDVSFAALRNSATGRRLIEVLPIATASSASSLVSEDGAAPRESVVAVALPSGDRTVALPESEAELADVSSLYRRSTSIAGERATFANVSGAVSRADVVHIAGHTERQLGDGEAVLVFADERVSWRAIAATTLSRRSVVVLAACETLRSLPSPSFALSLGDGYIAAGAGDVIGTLTPVSDADAREVFRAVHQQLATGASAAEALRRVQLQSLTRGNAWRSIAVRTSRIERSAKGERHG